MQRSMDRYMSEIKVYKRFDIQNPSSIDDDSLNTSMF